MPIIKESTYTQKPFFLRNAHMETIMPSIFRKVNGISYEREQLNIPDGDFLDIDWIRQGNPRLVILSHGLEGSSDRPYVKGAAKYFMAHGFDVLAWNYRSCSGEMNRLPRLYHHGVTDDLEKIVKRGLEADYAEMYLMGFSMGGSTTLKYLGELGADVDERIKAAAVFSVPCNLWDSAVQLTLPQNKFYKNRFLNKLKKKILLKSIQFPDKINASKIDKILEFDEFDERYTAPLHGFADAEDFYTSSSSDRVYHNIKIKSLIVNALNDPLLGEKCYPYSLAEENQHLFLETPALGGHVGFMQKGLKNSWMEQRAYEFFTDQHEKHQ